MQQVDRTLPLARPAAQSQQNPGGNRLAMLDGRRQAAFRVLREYYRAVEQGLAPVD